MRVAIGVLAIIVCLFLMQAAARVGLSRLLSRYALISNSLPAADEAVRVSPSDPDAHHVRAVVLQRLQMPAEAVKSLESATNLRYRDDRLWLELGSAREDVGDANGALAALDEAVRWAPYYAHTHWQRGNVLLRIGRVNEAFAELRKGVAANQTNLPTLIDLAWGISREDLKTTETLLDIKNDRERLAFIKFLARKGKGKEVIDEIKSLSSPVSGENRKELVQLLFAAKAFRDAFDLWADSPKFRVPALFNGGFEEPLVLQDTAFGGWIVSAEQSKTKLALDVSEKFDGARSLQITFAGEWTPGTALLSQTVVIEPGKTYPVRFSVKTKDLVTGGALMMTVNDAANDRLLGKSENFPAADSWVTVSFDFTTLETSEAAVIRLQRSNCNSSPCPIFGTLWLDEISIGPWKSEH